MDQIITDAQILYGSELDLKENYAVWLKDGVFHKVAPPSEMPTGLPIVSAAGSYMIPGLIDLHVHLIWDGSIDPVNTLERENREHMILRAVFHCQECIRHGITTVRDVGSVDDIALHIAQGINEGLINGPNVIASGKTITMTGGHDPFWARFCDGPSEALKAVREQIFKGAKVIKVSATGGVYGRVEGESAGRAELSYEELKVICDEAHRFDLKVASHAIGREGIENSIRAGVDTIEHGHYLDETLIKMMEEKGIAWIPTLFVYDQIANQSTVPEYARTKAREIEATHKQAFVKFFKRKILIGAGSDAGSPCTPHPSLIEELLEMNKSIPDKKEILKTATSNAGKILGRKVGEIKEGYQNDFVLLKENPLNDLNALKKVKQVYKEGQPILN